MPEIQNDRAPAPRLAVVEQEPDRPFPGRRGAPICIAFVEGARPGLGPFMGEGVEQGELRLRGAMAERRNGAR